jgi:hypothetical protein
MEAARKSIYDTLVIESNDQKQRIDLTGSVIGFEYYEDIFSPIVTAKLKIVNTGNSASTEKDTSKQSLYNGLPLRGGERLALRIKPNTKTNIALDFASKVENYFYVSSITDVIAESQKESFTLHLVPREAITNETVRVTRKYPTALSIDGSVEKILREVLQTKKIGKIDKTSNKYGFIGNMRKPFTILTWLASKSVPTASKDGTAGFLFYQTKEGFNFRSIDEMNKQSPKATYVYSEAVQSYAEDNQKVNNDFKILNYFIDRNQNLIEKLRLGTFASYRMFFNPLDFKFSNPEEGVFKQSDYVKSTENLGDRLKLPKVSDGSEQTLGDIPSRMITQILDIGTLEQDVSTSANSDPQKYQSQSLMRYNSLFTQQLNLIVPLNTNLNAGNVIECNFPKISSSDKKEFDQETSGLYMIKELCHHFDTESSYTSMKLLRDTFGQKK